MEPPPSTINDVPLAVDVPHVDRMGGHHRLVAAGPYLRCLEHPTREPQGASPEALAAVAHGRTCERLRIAWQQLMLADDPAATAVLRRIPRPLLAYLAAQTRRHAHRLDRALGTAVDARTRRRWHRLGWRAAPTLAGGYAASGIEAGTAFLALRTGVEPDQVTAALADPASPLARSLRTGRQAQVQELDLGFRAVITDDFPYEPLEG